MKKIFLLTMASLISSVFLNAQNYLIAKRVGSEYEMVISKKAFALVFDEQVGPFLSQGSNQKFIFEDLRIDDPEPSNIDSKAYCEVKASSKRETITVGINLIKEVLNDQTTRLYITNLIAAGSSTPDRAVAEAGWKCTSIRYECGGCRRTRENGVVVGCPCFTGEGYCNFETSGGGGNNWPGWLTSILLAILRFL